jgi:predicted nucleotidyltransferase component of viral defense system
MKKEKVTAPQGEVNLLERIKKLAITAMFSDDELFDILVLKGGNAMDLVHRLSSRASIDLDFSMSHDFPDGLNAFRIRVERALVNTFRIDGFEAFDIKMTEKPNQVTADMADFWGGYGVEFKLISSTLYEQYRENIDELRKYALQIGQGKKFLIDISRFEYIEQKKEFEFDGYRIFVYTPEMIVCEKLRAICQQMESYGSVIKRERAGSPRARDFLDIYVLISSLNLNIGSAENFELLKEMFKVKRVPLKLLEEIEIQREFHNTSFQALRATVKAGVQLKEFDFYFDYVLQLVAKLKPLWNV